MDESWTVKKTKCRRTDAFELWCWRKLMSPLDCKVIKPVNPKGNQSWIFIGRTDAEAETPIFWPPDVKNWLIGKDPNAKKVRRQVKGTIENEMASLDALMALLTRWRWVWASSGSWWWSGKPGVMQSIGSQRVGHDRATELNWIEAVSRFCAEKWLIWQVSKNDSAYCVKSRLWRATVEVKIPNYEAFVEFQAEDLVA